MELKYCVSFTRRLKSRVEHWTPNKPINQHTLKHFTELPADASWELGPQTVRFQKALPLYECGGSAVVSRVLAFSTEAALHCWRQNVIKRAVIHKCHLSMSTHAEDCNVLTS